MKRWRSRSSEGQDSDGGLDGSLNPRRRKKDRNLEEEEEEECVSVTCGTREGVLDVNKLQRWMRTSAEACIQCDGRWVTPPAFETLGGRDRAKKWKASIYCDGKPLGFWLERGGLGARKGGARTDGARRDGGRTDGARRDGARTNGGRRDGGRRDGARRAKKTKAKTKTRPSEREPPERSEASPPKEQKEIWSRPIYKLQLPVTCGEKRGTLKRDKLAKGEKCILSEKRWFTPSEFERFSGLESRRNWKQSIRCTGTPLSKLLEEGELQSAEFTRGRKKMKKTLFPSSQLIADSEEAEGQPSSSNTRSSAGITEEELAKDEEEEEEEQQSDINPSGVFRVSCGTLTGVLHKKRFATGICGKSIRTETSWLSPEDFAKVALSREEVSWRRDITWEGKPLSDLMQARTLIHHSVHCECPFCKPTDEDLENQRNDDECCVCKKDGEEKQLVQCDQCPRSFHQSCHLPGVGDDVLSVEDPWFCTFCIFRSNQAACYSDVENEKETLMNSQISRKLLYQCQYLLLTLCSADEEQIFTLDPRLHLENYSSFIQTPMWLCNVAEKLQNGKYETLEQFVSDVTLIFTNCTTYNQNDASLLAAGERLRRLFEHEFTKAFHIRE